MGTIANKNSGFISVGPHEARHAIASAFLASSIVPDDHDRARYGRLLGYIELKSHQADAIARLRTAIAEFGGALLCDPVGTGKTFCALALAASYERALVVGPAVLRPMWARASAEAHVPVTFVSHESLSRHPPQELDFDFVIVDEAHHARNTATMRFTALARIAAGRHVLLVTATPIHNRRGDLDALLSLFIGERASGLSNAEIGRCVVRRDDELAPAKIGTPAIEPLRWYEMPSDDSVANALLGLPPPLPPREGGDGGVLIAHSLIRQWASSDAALRGGLIRRRQRAIALIAALESGTYPSGAELAAWSVADDSVQLVFAELVASPVDETALLLAAIRAHHDGVCRLLEQIGSSGPRDDARAGVIREVRALHPHVPVVAFSQYEDTVIAMFRLLARDGEVAALTGGGGRVAGGRISRVEAIARFAPEASGRRRPSRAETATLLITTDLLSEGVNLQDAGVVIHLDLPWTPARMEQRLGRIARIGSPHASVFAYAFQPPASAEAVANIERTLAKKVRSASVLIGDFPSLSGTIRRSVVAPSEPQIVEELRSRLTKWVNVSATHVASEGALPARPSTRALVRVAGVSANAFGFLAACIRRGQVTLLGSVGGRLTDDPIDLLHCAGIAEGGEHGVDAATATAAAVEIGDWLAASAALEGGRPLQAYSLRAKRQVLRRISSTVNRARPHMRPHTTSLARNARHVLLGRLGASRESELAALLSLELADDEWLRAVIALDDPDGNRGQADDTEEHRIVALILFTVAIR